MQTYSEECYFKDVWNPSWGYEKLGPRGIGKNNIIVQNMDKYLPEADFTELDSEVCIGLAGLPSVSSHGSHFAGSVPPFELEKFDGIDGWSQIFRYLEDYDFEGIHRTNIEKIINMYPKSPQSARRHIYKYIHYAIGGPMPWFYVLALRNSEFLDKNERGKSWDAPEAKLFPKTMEYISKLPMKFVGRIVIFTSLPNAGVVCHRDAPSVEHKDHSINMFFAGTRPSYVYDEINNKKIYVDPGSKSYFFNDRDYHGVDPEPRFRYTVRADGEFEDWVQEELGLEDGYTWKESYLRSS